MFLRKRERLLRVGVTISRRELWLVPDCENHASGIRCPMFSQTEHRAPLSHARHTQPLPPSSHPTGQRLDATPSTSLARR